jgi:hypothetical protein
MPLPPPCVAARPPHTGRTRLPTLSVAALTNDLYTTVTPTGLPIGVNVPEPCWARTRTAEAERNWSSAFGERPPDDPAFIVTFKHMRQTVEEGSIPALIANAVAAAVTAGPVRVPPHQEFRDLAARRWDMIAEWADPTRPRRRLACSRATSSSPSCARALGL